jgi:long-chain fatty acid transport protein
MRGRSAEVAWAAWLAWGCAMFVGRPVADASGFGLGEQSATASGTAGAGAARQNDAGLAWYNPAALADGAGLRLGAALTLARSTFSAQALDGSFHTTTEARWWPLPHFDASFARGDFVGGLSLGVPFGNTVRWPADWPGRRESVYSELAVGRAAPFLGLQLGPVRLAAGVHLDLGRMRLGRELDFIDEDGEATIDMDGSGIGFDASIFWQVRDDLDFGLVYRGRTRIELEGGADFTVPVPLSDRAADQGASTRLTLPDQFVLGARFHRGSWAALADVELTLWGVYDRLVIDLADPAMEDVVEDAQWHSTLALRGGVEFAPVPALVLRTGVYYDPSPVPDATLSAAVPDASRVGLTLGGSVELGEQWAIDAFYELLLLMQRSSAPEGGLAASYGGSAHFLGFGLRFSAARGDQP